MEFDPNFYQSWVQVHFKNSQNLIIFGYPAGFDDPDIVNLGLKFTESLSGLQFTIFLDIDVAAVSDLNPLRADNSVYNITLYEGREQNFTLPYDLIYARYLDLRNSTMNHSLSLSLKPNYYWLVLKELNLTAQVPLGKNNYSTELYAYDKFNLSYKAITLNINAIDPLGNQISRILDLYEKITYAGEKTLIDLTSYFAIKYVTDSEVVKFGRYNPEDIQQQIEWPDWIQISGSLLIVKPPPGLKEVKHIHIEAYNEVDVPMIKQGIVSPVFIQMSLIIGPNPKKLGNSSKLLQISTYLYISGALFSCIALIVTLSTHFVSSNI